MLAIRFSFVCLFFGLITVLPGKQAHSQNNSLREIKSALQFAAARAHVSLIVEGEPYKKKLNADEAVAIETIGTDAPPKELLAQVARAYDYETWLQKGTNVYVLKKRYSEPDDLPYVTLEETKAAITDIAQLLTNISLDDPYGHTAPSQILSTFAASLSNEQLSSLRDEAKGLSVGSLSSEQQSQIRRIPSYIFLHTTEQEILRVKDQVYVITDPATTLGKGTGKDEPFFGYEGFTLDSKRLRIFRALNRAGSSSQGNFVITSVNGVRVPNFAEPQSEPPSSNELASGEVSRVSQTLREAVQQTQSRLGSNTQPLTVDDQLANKPVLVVNPSAASPETILRALSDVYGLRIVTKTDGSRSIVRARLPQIKSVMDVPQALTQLLPDPFLRALHWRENNGISPYVPRKSEVASQEGTSTKPNLGALSPAFNTSNLIRRQGMVKDSASDIRWAALRVLRAGIEPRLKSEAKSMISISSITEVQQSALSDVLLTDLWAAINRRLVNPAPNYVVHFEDGYITGGYGKYNGKNSFSVQFRYRNAEGKLVDSGATYTAILSDKK